MRDRFAHPRLLKGGSRWQAVDDLTPYPGEDRSYFCFVPALKALLGIWDKLKLPTLGLKTSTFHRDGRSLYMGRGLKRRTREVQV